MKNNCDKFLQNNLSIDELNIDMPDISLVNQAREKVAARRPQVSPNKNIISTFFSFFSIHIQGYQIAIASLLLMFGIFYFNKSNTRSSGENSVAQNAINNYSISSSTVLASLTQYTNNKTATNSSTVLTSIITFVIRN